MVLVFCAPAFGGDGGLVFTDVSDVAGVGLPGVLTESLAWGDYDGDGDQDLYLTNLGPNVLFRNDGGDVFTDVTATAGVGSASFSVGAAFGDLDNDGDLDLYVVTFPADPDVLYRNDGPIGPEGETVFTDVTIAAGTTIGRSSRGVGLLDYDRDGLLDIYVNAVGEDILYHNLGDLQFQDVAAILGTNPAGVGVGVVLTDIDNNGWIDIYNGNRSFDLSNLFMNNGGTFTDIASEAGINAVGLGMGVLAFDYDNDLDMDLYWTVWPGDGADANVLYRNEGRGSFIDVAARTGTTDVAGWGISCNAGDIDNDRWMDFFVTNGFSDESSPNVLFHNNNGKSFQDVTAALGGADFDGRGVAFADYDNDGDLDLCVTGSVDDPTRLWRNDTPSGNHWLTLDLAGRISNRSAIGARIEVTAGGVTTVQEVSGGAGRGSFNSLPVEFGLGAETSVQSVSIRWPRGMVQTLGPLATDQLLVVVEPSDPDLDGDGDVDPADLAQLLSAWGPCEPRDPCLADLNGDGVVNPTDLAQLLGNWGD